MFKEWDTLGQRMNSRSCLSPALIVRNSQNEENKDLHKSNHAIITRHTIGDGMVNSERG
jgi:hypothetical protein